jgi:hypothetical protein
MKRTKWTRAVRVAACALVLAGCGDLTAGGLGEVEIYATADDTGSTPSAMATPSAHARRSSSSAPSATSPAASVFDGLLVAQMQVYLQNDMSGQWVELTEGVRDLTLELRGGLERRVAVRFVDSGRYTRLRVVFRKVEASVTGGLVVGGVPLTGLITVDLGAQGALTVEREMLLEVERDESVDVVMDLNVDVWLPTVSVLTRTVAAAALQGALAVRVR